MCCRFLVSTRDTRDLNSDTFACAYICISTSSIKCIFPHMSAHTCNTCTGSEEPHLSRQKKIEGFRATFRAGLMYMIILSCIFRSYLLGVTIMWLFNVYDTLQCVCIYICIYMCAYIVMPTHVYACACVRVCVQMCVCANKCACVHASVRACGRAWTVCTRSESIIFASSRTNRIIFLFAWKRLDDRIVPSLHL